MERSYSQTNGVSGRAGYGAGATSSSSYNSSQGSSSMVNGTGGKSSHHKGSVSVQGQQWGGGGHGGGVTVGPRMELEVLYDGLKSGLTAEQWATYKSALSGYVLGRINRQELGVIIDSYIQGPKVRLHNQLILGMLYNSMRDPPPLEIAPWVSSTNKPSALAGAGGPGKGNADAHEARLKVEVMALAGRDRRRIKEIAEENNAQETLISELYEYHQAKQVKIPAAIGPANKTNLEAEIKSRYHIPLACESGEFPDLETIRLRMLPICYEEGVVGGITPDTASFMNVAAEVFVKEILSNVIHRVRSNASGYIKTDMCKRKDDLIAEREAEIAAEEQTRKENLERLQKEAEDKGLPKETVKLPLPQTGNDIDWGTKRRKRKRENKINILSSNLHIATSSLLPTGERRHLGMNDLRLSLSMGDNYLCQLPHSLNKIMSGGWEHQDNNNTPRVGIESALDELPASMTNISPKKRRIVDSSRMLSVGMSRVNSAVGMSRGNSSVIGRSSLAVTSFSGPTLPSWGIRNHYSSNILENIDVEPRAPWVGEEDIGFADDSDCGEWEGGGKEDRIALRGLLDDVLAV